MHFEDSLKFAGSYRQGFFRQSDGQLTCSRARSSSASRARSASAARSTSILRVFAIRSSAASSTRRLRPDPSRSRRAAHFGLCLFTDLKGLRHPGQVSIRHTHRMYMKTSQYSRIGPRDAGSPNGRGDEQVEGLRATRSCLHRVHRPIGPSARSRDIWVNASCGSFLLRVHHGPCARPSSTFLAFFKFHILLLLAQRSCRCVDIPSQLTQRPLFLCCPAWLGPHTSAQWLTRYKPSLQLAIFSSNPSTTPPSLIALQIPLDLSTWLFPL